MAKAVGAALARLEPLIVEAGTGTGKTFAYLIPALLSGRSVIISTGTRTLQDQLFRRDVPMLAKALGLPAKLALLKGRTNYLCRHRLELATQQGALLGPERGVARLLARVSRWAATTKTGDLAELTDLPEQSPIWPSITSTRENCLGQECPQFSRCHVIEARRNAQAADIVVVNHHLLLADLALKDEGFGDLLPGAEAVILDEAHQVPDIAAQFFGQTWSVRQVQVLMRDITAELSVAAIRAPSLVETVLAVDGHLDGLRFALNLGKGRYEWAESARHVFGCAAGNRNHFERPQRAARGVGRRRRHRQLRAPRGASGQCAGPACASCRRRRVCAGWRLGPHGLTLQFTPFEIAERLREYVESRPCAWIFTSATLAIAADFSHFAERIGLPDARTLCIDSPFDYRDQARLFLPPRMPDPQDPGVRRKIHRGLCAADRNLRRPRVPALHQLSRLGGWGAGAESTLPRSAFPGVGAGRGAARSLAEPLSRTRQRGAAGHGQFLGRRGRQGRCALHRCDRQATLRRTRRSAAQSPARGNSPARRQSVL